MRPMRRPPVRLDRKARRPAARLGSRARSSPRKVRERLRGQSPENRSEGYDELNVGAVVERLDNLSAEELQQVRAYERWNKNRSSLLKQIDRRINAAS